LESGVYCGSFSEIHLQFIGLAMFACVTASFLAAVLIGFVCVRFTRTYFIMLTVAFSELIYAIGHKWASLTGGDDDLWVFQYLSMR